MGLSSGRFCTSSSVGDCCGKRSAERTHPQLDVELLGGLAPNFKFTVLEMYKMENAPSLDMNSESDPFVVGWVQRRGLKDIQELCEPKVFPFRLNCDSPVWDSKRVLLAPLVSADGASKDDELALKIYDYDDDLTVALFGQDVIGHAYFPVADLEAAVARQDLCTAAVELSDLSKSVIQKSGKESAPCTVSIRVWPGSVCCTWPTSKWLFLLRHGESKWNEAQAKLDIAGLVKTTDHSLDAVGIHQARDLSKKIRDATPGETSLCHYKEFLDAEEILVSPLRRTVETALIALHYHPLATSRGIKLFSDLREVKNVGGLDCIGSATGDRIVGRVHEELDKAFRTQDIDQDELTHIKSIHVDPNNARDEWWMDLKDTHRDIQHRIADLLVQFKLTPKRNHILVGHSLLFRELCRNFSCPSLKNGATKFKQQLREKVMAPCAVMAIHVDFTQPIHSCVDDAMLMFGTGFKGDHDFHETTGSSNESTAALTPTSTRTHQSSASDTAT